jgi:hypothetical protein
VMDWLSQHARPIVDSLLYSVLGTVVLLAAFAFIEKVLPFSLRKEIAEDQNVASGSSWARSSGRLDHHLLRHPGLSRRRAVARSSTSPSSSSPPAGSSTSWWRARSPATCSATRSPSSRP